METMKTFSTHQTNKISRKTDKKFKIFKKNSKVQGGAKRTHVFEMGSSRESEGRQPPHSASNQKSTFENLVQSTI